MTLQRTIAAAVAFAALTFGQSSSQNGIWVDQPKVYDDYFLQTQLSALKARLGSLSGLDQADRKSTRLNPVT